MLLSRVADSLYWISRYLERAEHTVRLIDVRLDLGLDRRHSSAGWDFERLYTILRLSRAGELPDTSAALIEAVIFDVSNPDSVAASITAARENARQVREEISADMWEQVNRIYLRLKQVRAEGLWSARPHYLSRIVIEGVHLFQGITDATMGHGEGWQYLQVGRFLERAESSAALIDRYFTQASRGGGSGSFDHGEWIGLLRSCSGLEAYCRHYTADLRPERIAEFLLLNAEFPRSVRFAAAHIDSALQAIAQHTSRGAIPSPPRGQTAQGGGGRAERLAGRLHASLDYGQVDEILSDNPHAYLTGIGRLCTQIHTAMYQGYIGYRVESALPA